MSWWMPTAQSAREQAANPIVYHTTTTALGTSHQLRIQVREGRYILRSAVAFTNEEDAFPISLGIYSIDSDYLVEIHSETQYCSVQDFFCMAREVNFQGPAYIGISATSPTNDSLVITLGLEKVSSQ